MKQTTLSDAPDSLMEQIVDPANMQRAWKNVNANRGAPGPNGVTLDEFFQTFRGQWPTVRQQLLEGTYEPHPARRKSIPKPDGSERHLGIPNVQERLIQQAILQVLTPIFDPEFSESSFGFRPKRSAQQAAQQVQTHIRAGYRHCVDMDLSKCFGQSSWCPFPQPTLLRYSVAKQFSSAEHLWRVGEQVALRFLVHLCFCRPVVDAIANPPAFDPELLRQLWNR